MNPMSWKYVKNIFLIHFAQYQFACQGCWKCGTGTNV